MFSALWPQLEDWTGTAARRGFYSAELAKAKMRDGLGHKRSMKKSIRELPNSYELEFPADQERFNSCGMGNQ